MPATMGETENNVYFDGTQYTYVHTVTPSLNDNAFLNTAFVVGGYTGVSGWSFSEAMAAGGNGTLTDFVVFELGQIGWLALFGPLGWDANEPISFFFVSTRPPTIGDYNIIGHGSRHRIQLCASAGAGFDRAPWVGAGGSLHCHATAPKPGRLTVTRVRLFRIARHPFSEDPVALTLTGFFSKRSMEFASMY